MRITAGLFSCVALLAAACAHGQNLPGKLIRIHTSEAGSTSDFLARLIAQGMTVDLGLQVIVENRGGLMAADAAFRAAPDGATLVLNGSSLWTAVLVRNDVPYDPVKDFAPITLAADAPNVLVASGALPVRSVTELIALAKSKPGTLNYGSGSTGAPSHFGMELFKSMAGVDIVRIPYKGTSPALTALLAGQVQMMILAPTAVLGHMKSGKLTGLAVTNSKPSALAPGLPTVASQGLPGFEVGAPFGLFAPAKTPPAIVKRLNQAMVQVLVRPDAREQMLKAGVDSVASSPEEFVAYIAADLAKWGQLVKAAGIK
jgi:tripartite-type tricarboxylate transporter receptor subunit TctC